MKQLSDFHIDFLHCPIQSLPSRTALSAVYLLIGGGAPQEAVKPIIFNCVIKKKCDQVTDVGRVSKNTAIHCQFRLFYSKLGKTA